MYSFRKLLCLDIGGVLLSDAWPASARQKAAQRFDLDYVEMEQLHNLVFPVYETGKITLDAYLDQVVFMHSRNFERQDFKNFMFAQSFQLPGMLPWLVEWKRSNPGIKLVSVNNEGRELNDFRIRKFHLHRCFDAFFSSCILGLRKPDPAIYGMALKVMQIDPENCLYIDDRMALVQAAKGLGLQTHHHLGFEQTKEIIERFEYTENGKI